MKDDRASRTADRVAERRAAHQLLDSPRIFDDPLALRIIRPEAARVLRENPKAYNTTFGRYLRAFVSMRSRFAEDALREAYARGVRQYVILGAGFDTFAYRNPFPDLRVWEVDHPATQDVKRRRLAAAGLTISQTLTLVAADLSQVALGDALGTAGVDASQPAFVAWLGVAMYLELGAIRATLRSLGSLPAGTGLVFDYSVPPSSLNWLARFLYGRVLTRVAAIGEPFKTFFLPAGIAKELSGAGFTVVEDLGPSEINAMYFQSRSDGLKVSAAGRIVSARVSQ